MRFRLRDSIAAAVAFAMLFLSGCASAVDPGEVEQSANPVTEMHRELTSKLEDERNRVEWYSYEDALKKARKEGRYVMVEFYATWCKWCKKFEAETLADTAVRQSISSDFVAVRMDAESADRVVHEMRQMTMFELADLYGVQNFPTIWFLEPDGSRAKQLNGYMEPSEFSRYLTYIKSGAYREREF